MNVDTIYRRLGEFVVSFQWLENRFREVGWLILDSEKKQWPPRTLRNETNHDLLVKIEELYLNLIDQVAPADAEERKQSFCDLVSEAHEMRQYRNRLAHSAYIELKSRGEVIGLLRSNPKIKENGASGQVQRDQESLTESSFDSRMEQMGKIVWDLNIHYMQLIHWAPFNRD